jgi:hypothetical protein
VAPLAFAGCADMRAEVAVPASRPEAAAPVAADVGLGGVQDHSLTALRAQDQRVADIAFRLVTASAELCADQSPQTGLVLQSALEYSPRLRPQARRQFGLGDAPAVEAVAARSPAAAAGLKVGDSLVAVNGAPLPTAPAPSPGAPDPRPAAYQPVEVAQARIAAALTTGPAELTVLRGATTLRFQLTGQPGCDYDAQVLPGSGLSASADGRHVFISTAFVNYARSDDMLALVLGHEFAHDVLRHRERLDAVGFQRRTLGPLGATPGSLRRAEREADYVGLYLTARAGYDISQAAEFWRRFPRVAGDLGWSHPDPAQRSEELAATRDEIALKRSRGEPLLPNRVAD